ncbi:slipin family protein [Parasphingorhabdus litoris]|uniref:slipin family protein n=1 Tax=Parasphingorhabdus litoris TaxID=394733 RepID=UPI001E431E02|nr:slipin family protein [Parasphingorhabdus litoris]
MLNRIKGLKGNRYVTVNERERVIWFYKGALQGILGPGEHKMPNDQEQLVIDRLTLEDAAVPWDYEKMLFRQLPDQAAEHLTLFQTGPEELAIVERDGRIENILYPDDKLTVWTDAGPWKVELITLDDNPFIEPALFSRLIKSGTAEVMDIVKTVQVDNGQIALFMVDGEIFNELPPGHYGYWDLRQKVVAKIIDLSRQPLDVNGQELLTKDRVTIRINLSAEYRVVDPVKAVTEVKDFADALYRALQYAFRKTLGAMTLDQILDKQVTVDAEAAQKVRSDMAAIGLEVSEIILKDVILPGEMRELLNQVVSAQKAAEANVIKRREETNATRSLLNTAKVMADNPVMLRLKELEALESIAGKVDRLTVNNGTSGLMNDIVNLTED